MDLLACAFGWGFGNMLWGFSYSTQVYPSCPHLLIFFPFISKSDFCISSDLESKLQWKNEESKQNLETFFPASMWELQGQLGHCSPSEGQPLARTSRGGRESPQGRAVDKAVSKGSFDIAFRVCNEVNIISKIFKKNPIPWDLDFCFVFKKANTNNRIYFIERLFVRKEKEGKEWPWPALCHPAGPWQSGVQPWAPYSCFCIAG